jgi:hypothetical protein
MNLAVKAIFYVVLSMPTLAQQVQTAAEAEKQTSPKLALTKRSATKDEQQDRKFGFSIVSVQNERPPSTMYRVEGLTEDKVRFLLSCHSVPPPLPGLGGWEGSPRERLVRWYNQYGDIEKFRKTAIESVYLAAEVSKHKGVILLYARGKDAVADSDAPLDEIVDQCAILTRIPNAENAYSIKVISSTFQSRKDGTGYETEAQAADELLTLGCSEGKGHMCASLPPNGYRAIRSGSEVKVYDENLTLVGDFRVLSERKQ